MTGRGFWVIRIQANFDQIELKFVSESSWRNLIVLIFFLFLLKILLHFFGICFFVWYFLLTIWKICCFLTFFLFLMGKRYWKLHFHLGFFGICWILICCRRFRLGGKLDLIILHRINLLLRLLDFLGFYSFLSILFLFFRSIRIDPYCIHLQILNTSV